MRKIVRFATTVISAYETWLPIVLAIPSVLTGIEAKAAGFSTPEIVLFTSSVLAVCMMVAHYGILLGERAVQEIGDRKIRRKVARQLEDLLSVGHQSIDLRHIATLWVGHDSRGTFQEAAEWNVAFRRLKIAVRQGLIEKIGKRKKIDSQTECTMESAISFLRSGRKWAHKTKRT